jgi:hypothetical protein
MNWIVLVGFLILLPTPLASRPNLFLMICPMLFFIWRYGAVVCS